MRKDRVLVADDEIRIVENIARTLEREGFEVTSAHSGDQAVALFDDRHFDLVLLDISMPGLNGYEVIEALKKRDPDVLIIIMTGYASVESAVKALRLGAWDYLKKPFESAKLVTTVANGIAQHNLIKEKKAFSARLEASEKKYEYMVNHSPDLVFTLDDRGAFTYVNQQFKRVLGMARSRLIGQPFWKVVHDQDQDQARDIVTAVAQKRGGSGPVEMHVRFRKTSEMAHRTDPAGAYAYMELRASAINSPGKNNPKTKNGVYAVARDVTERLLLENQLRQAQKMEAIGTLAGGIAHDFNNILMGIQGYASLVRSDFDRDSVAFKRLSNIDEYVNNGAEMARQLLGFAQKSVNETHPLNLNYLLKMSAKMFGRTKKDIRINQELEKKLWSCVVDESQLKQVLMNLFVNAWHAMPNGGNILVKSENTTVDERTKDELGLEKAGAYVGITVSDTGVGMDKETQARIFDPFFTTKSRGQGTGLGLATAYGIVKSHKGAFRVASDPGKGSAFTFYLPASNARAQKGTSIHSEPGKLVAGKGRVLLVDDEKGVIEVCSEMLETLGYEVLAAPSGQDALSLYRENMGRIDLVILDMVMPGMSGAQTYEMLRKIDPAARVLVCSGYSREEEIRQMVAKGCCDYIYKPFDVAMLSEKLQTVFLNSSAAKYTDKVG